MVDHLSESTNLASEEEEEEEGEEEESDESESAEDLGDQASEEAAPAPAAQGTFKRFVWFYATVPIIVEYWEAKSFFFFLFLLCILIAAVPCFGIKYK